MHWGRILGSVIRPCRVLLLSSLLRCVSWGNMAGESLCSASAMSRPWGGGGVAVGSVTSCITGVPAPRHLFDAYIPV